MTHCMQLVKNYLDREGFVTHSDDDVTFLRFFVEMEELTLKVVVIADADWLSIRACLPFKAPKAKRMVVSRLLAHFNWNYRNGTFAIDFNDGEIGISADTPYRDEGLDEQTLESQFDALMRMISGLLRETQDLISRTALGSLSAGQAIAIYAARQKEKEICERVPQQLLDLEAMACN